MPLQPMLVPWEVSFFPQQKSDMFKKENKLPCVFLSKNGMIHISEQWSSLYGKLCTSINIFMKNELFHSIKMSLPP